MRFHELAIPLTLLPLLLLSLSCNEVAPTQGTETGAGAKFPINVMPRVSVNYPLAMNNSWVYTLVTGGVYADSMRRILGYDTGYVSTETYSIVDSLPEPSGTWWKLERRSDGLQVQYLSRHDTVYERDSMYLNPLKPRPYLLYVPAPLVFSDSFSTYEYAHFGPFTKTVVRLDTPVVTEAGVFKHCISYTGEVRYPDLDGPYLMSITSIVAPGIGLVKRIQINWQINVQFPGASFYMHTLKSYQLRR